MTDDPDPTVEDGQEGRQGDREAQNDTRLETGLSGQKPIPSAPPNPCSIRVWTESGENSDTTLLHTVPKRPSKKRSPTVGSPPPACSTTLLHTPSKQPLRLSPRSSDNGRQQSSGLIVRGSTYYLRLRVPRPLAGVIGKTHVVKSLGTGYRAEAVRKARIVAASLEAAWSLAERCGVPTPAPAQLATGPKPLSARPEGLHVG